MSQVCKWQEISASEVSVRVRQSLSNDGEPKSRLPGHDRAIGTNWL